MNLSFHLNVYVNILIKDSNWLRLRSSASDLLLNLISSHCLTLTDCLYSIMLKRSYIHICVYIYTYVCIYIYGYWIYIWNQNWMQWSLSCETPNLTMKVKIWAHIKLRPNFKLVECISVIFMSSSWCFICYTLLFCLWIPV